MNEANNTAIELIKKAAKRYISAISIFTPAFDHSDDMIEVCNARDELEKLISEDVGMEQCIFEKLKSKAAIFNIDLNMYNGHYYLQHFEAEIPFLFDSDLEHISLFLAGYIEATKRLT